MNFPMDSPFFQFLYWLMNTPGLGGIAVVGLAAALAVIFATTLFWIGSGAKAKEANTYAYPTPALHDHR